MDALHVFSWWFQVSRQLLQIPLGPTQLYLVFKLYQCAIARGSPWAELRWKCDVNRVQATGWTGSEDMGGTHQSESYTQIKPAIFWETYLQQLCLSSTQDYEWSGWNDEVQMFRCWWKKISESVTERPMTGMSARPQNWWPLVGTCRHWKSVTLIRTHDSHM